jgi:hypothetical protein
LKLLASKYSLSSQKKVILKEGSKILINCSRSRSLYSQAIIDDKNRIFFGGVIKRFSSSKANISQYTLKPYIAGFIDGEGNFYIKVVKSSNNRTGYSVQLTFGLILHDRDLALLKLIQAEFKGVGHI